MDIDGDVFDQVNNNRTVEPLAQRLSMAPRLRLSASVTAATVCSVSKTVTEVPVELNELALSLLGWEVQDFRARVSTEQHKTGGSCFHKIAISGVFRFNDADWVDCFSYSREYPNHPVMLLSSPAISDQPAVCRLYVGDIKQGRPLRIAEDDWFIHTYRPIDHTDLRIEVTAYDAVASYNGIAYIPLVEEPIAIELADESTPSSVRLTVDRLEAFQHRKDDDDEGRYGLIVASGRVIYGTPEELLADWVATWQRPARTTPTVADKAPFSRQTPRLTFDVLDDTGFMLEQLRGDVDITIHVDEHGKTPSRAPRWLVNLAFDPDDYSAPVSRIVARIEDR